MPCYSPLRAQRSGDGGVRIVDKAALFDFSVPCGRCIGCRLRYSQMWAIRCLHEAELWPVNCCITLTYAPNNIPEGGSLKYEHFQAFLKRLRDWARRNDYGKIRFFMGGEYGERGGAPHYHALLFNFDFPDKQVFQERNGVPHLWTSKILEKLWPFGFATVGLCSWDSASYIARYIVKKQYGATKAEWYKRLDRETGEVYEIDSEFAHMSLKPGIGAKWLERYWSDVFPSGKVVVNGAERRAPRFYDKRLSVLDSDGYAVLALDRILDARKFARDNTSVRLAVREAVALARANAFKRKI